MDKDDKRVKILPWVAFLGFALSAYIEGIFVFIFQIYNPYANPMGFYYSDPTLGGQIAGAFPLTLIDWVILQFVIELPIIVVLTAYIVKLWKE